MTHCVGMLLQEGLLLASDTRTNAGVDHILSMHSLYDVAMRVGRTVREVIARDSGQQAQGTGTVDFSCTLVSFDSTIRLNLSVGLPIDLLVHRTDDFRPHEPFRFGGEHPYLRELRSAWSAGLRSLFTSLPDIDIET